MFVEVSNVRQRSMIEVVSDVLSEGTSEMVSEYDIFT